MLFILIWFELIVLGWWTRHTIEIRKELKREKRRNGVRRNFSNRNRRQSHRMFCEVDIRWTTLTIWLSTAMELTNAPTTGGVDGFDIFNRRFTIASSGILSSFSLIFTSIFIIFHRVINQWLFVFSIFLFFCTQSTWNFCMYFHKRCASVFEILPINHYL